NHRDIKTVNSSVEVSEKDKKQRRQRCISFCIADWVMFTMSLQFSIYFASLWPYLSQVNIDKNATENFFGWVVATYCLGQIVGSPLFGMWSNRRGSVRVPCLTSLIITVFGNALMVCAEGFPANNRFVVLCARFVMGCAAGR
ncbi:unnamed protein product, partial [Soboliphyme baturini]|uniref:MFS domain-containing protein n=1 Tax=Soboliphyme baturini TaxID=241478 RepID=A0A183IIP5_9BILA